jgi:hypothetical protein
MSEREGLSEGINRGDRDEQKLGLSGGRHG